MSKEKVWKMSQEDVIGLFYAGYGAIGVAVGTLIGYVIGGGRPNFLDGGWIDTIIGLVVGSCIGIGCALIKNAKQLNWNLLINSGKSENKDTNE